MRSKCDMIFVQIPSYKDTQLIDTIDSMLKNAYNKKRLNIHICWQHDKNEKLPNRILNNNTINIIDINFKNSKGANWARSILQKKWNNEPYSFLVDSHTRFVKNWDKKLIDMMIQLKKMNVSKPIISCLPPSFLDPKTFPKDRLDYPGKIYSKAYQFNVLARFHSISIPHYNWIKSPISAQFIAMGFLFTEGYFNIDIPFDPNIYFFGDDITTALRAYSHGYDLFHPHKIIAWHLYDRRTRTPHWDDHKNWIQIDRLSFKRAHNILKGKELDEYCIIGKHRSIANYEKYIGQKLTLR